MNDDRYLEDFATLVAYFCFTVAVGLLAASLVLLWWVSEI